METLFSVWVQESPPPGSPPHTPSPHHSHPEDQNLKRRVSRGTNVYRTCIHVFPSRTCTCHIAVVASKLAVARQRPSGDQARARTVRDCSSKMEVHAHWLSLEATPGAQLQMRTILSPLQLASILPATDTCASCHHIPLRLNLNAALFNVGVFWLCYPSQAAQLFTTVRPPQVLSTAMFELSVFISMPVTLCVCVCVSLANEGFHRHEHNSSIII